VISPALLNVVRHGMEDAAGVRYQRSGTDAAHTAAGSPVLVRYADDLVVLCHSRQQAEQAKARLPAWLAPRGLAFNEDKTRIVTLGEGSGLPGFHRPPIPRQAADQTGQGGREADPGTAAHRNAVPARGQRAGGHRPAQPLVRGWPAYYRTVVSSQTFTALDHYLWKLTCKWASIVTRTSRPGGSSAATSARPASPGRTGGCPATATAVPASPGSPGRRSSGTRWSGEPRHPTIPPWPNTGLPGGDEEYPAPSTRPPCGSCSPSTAAAPAAGNSSSTLTGRRKPHVNGNNGWRPSARR
jgi:hypothetical protein